MSYQAFINNRSLQQSLQDSFAGIQTSNDQTVDEEKETEDENKTAQTNTVSEEKSQSREEGGIAIPASLLPLLATRIGSKTIGELGAEGISKAVSEGVQGIKSGISGGLQRLSEQIETGEGSYTASAGRLESMGSGMANRVTQFLNPTEPGASLRMGSSARNDLMTLLDDPELSDVAGSAIRSQAADVSSYIPTSISTAVSDIGTTVRTGASSLESSVGNVFNAVRSNVASAQAAGEGAVVQARTGAASLQASGESAVGQARSGASALQATGEDVVGQVRSGAASLQATGEGVATNLAENVAPKLAISESGELIGGEAVAAAIPGLDIAVALGGLAFGLYDLFHHSKTPNAPPPPPAPLITSQSVATAQSGI